MAASTRTVDDLIAQGIARHREGDFPAAEVLFREAAALAPDDPDPKQLLGAVLVDRGETRDAIDILDDAIDLSGPLTTTNVGLYNNYGNALRVAGRFEEAEGVLRELTVVAPGEWRHWHNYAHLLKDTERYDEAVAPIRRAIALEPGHGPNHAVLGSILYALGRLNSAVAAFRKCIDLGSDQDVNVWTQLGNTYRLLGEADKSEAALVHANEMAHAPSTYSNLAVLLNQRGRFEEAHEHLRAAMELEPDVDMWRNNYGYSQLTAGDLPAGWHSWEHTLVAGPRGNERKTGVPRWVPDDADVRLLCYREQGVGDEILFASCLPDLAGRVRELIYEADPRLITLFQRSFPTVEVRESTWTMLGPTQRDYDRTIPIGSLGLHLRATVDMFPADQRSYLVADPERVEQLGARLRAEADGGPVIGISWRSRIKTAERRLEYTHLPEVGGLLSIPGITWVNLQYDDCERELFAAEQEFGVKIHRWKDIDYMNDFEEVAALMALCDLVVAPRNAVAMLSGALGRPTVMMGNRWDWSDLGTDTCPWLPSVNLVYRHVGEDWDGVLATATKEVAAVASRKETA